MNSLVDSKILLARDYSSLIEWSIDKIPKITKEWTDFSITSPEMIWLSASCYAYDMLNFTLERKFLDNQIRFSRSFDNVLNMCKLLGVDVPGFMSSKLTLKINFDDTNLPLGDTITISKGSSFTVFDSANLRNINFVASDTYTLNFGDNYIDCYEGTLTEKTLSVLDFTSRGTYIIDDISVGHNTVELIVNNIAWNKVDNAFLISQNSPCFSVSSYSDDYTLLKLMPGFGSEIDTYSVNLSYMITSGSLGNISTSSTVEFNFPVLDAYGTNVKDNVSILVMSSSGGEDSYGVDEAKSLLGTEAAQVKTLVIEEDYELKAIEVEDVYSCVVKDDLGVKKLYYVASESALDVDIIANIDSTIANLVPAFTSYEIYPVNVRPVSIEVRIYLNRNELDITGLHTKVEEYITNIFARENVTAGIEFNRSVLAQGIENLSNTISHVIFDYPLADIYSDWNEIIDIDNLSILFERG